MSPPFDEPLRYEYPLNKDSLVIDGGGFEGNWAAGMSERYGCTVIIFEPVHQFFSQLLRRFQSADNVAIDCAGLGGADCENGKQVKIYIRNNSSGLFSPGPEAETVKLYSASIVVGKFTRPVDVLKLNIEGCEFDVIEDLIGSGQIKRVKNIQVQWHDCAPDAVMRFDALQKKLTETHELTLDSGWVWQNWKLK